jgi:MoxR-like ATPase
MVTNADEIRILNEKIQKASGFIDKIEKEIARVIVGQNYMVSRLLVGLLSNGHVLLEGVPGLLKHLQLNHFPKLSMPSSAGSSSHRICCLRT